MPKTVSRETAEKATDIALANAALRAMVDAMFDRFWSVLITRRPELASDEATKTAVRHAMVKVTTKPKAKNEQG
jgi:hypothetical protein